MTPSSSPSTPTILIVDDDWLNRELLDGLLSFAGYRVLEAANGKAALILAEQQPDAIIMDVRMPQMNGYEACKQLKSNPATQHIPILLVSAAEGPEEHASAETAGADDFLSRGQLSSELVRRVQHLLDPKKD